MIAKEGWGFILTGFVVAAVLANLARLHELKWLYTVAGVFGLLALFCLFFFRNPHRPLTPDPALLYSAGDGRVISIEREGARKGQTIRVFLSLLNVHVQRAPSAGTVRRIERHPGRFALAMKPHAKENARVLTTFETSAGKSVEVEQIVGFIARRIRTWVAEGDIVQAGQCYGLIQFGSQVAVHLPEGAEPVVRVGDHVKGGVTPIARWIKGS